MTLLPSRSAPAAAAPAEQVPRRRPGIQCRFRLRVHRSTSRFRTTCSQHRRARGLRRLALQRVDPTWGRCDRTAWTWCGPTTEPFCASETSSVNFVQRTESASCFSLIGTRGRSLTRIRCACAKPIDGANDGGSGVGVLLEIARLLGADSTLDVGVDIVFFDAEDYGTPEWGEKTRTPR